MNTRLTPTEQRLYEALADGLPHLPEDLCKCLWDDASGPDAVQVHVSNLRRKIAHLGELIVCEFATRRMWYRRCRKLTTSDK